MQCIVDGPVPTYVQHTIHTYVQDRLHLLYTVERISDANLGGQGGGGRRVSKRAGEWMNDDNLTTGFSQEARHVQPASCGST